MGHQFLTGAGLAADQQRRIDLRHTHGSQLELVNGGGVAQDGFKSARVVVLQGAQALANTVRRV